MLQQVLYENADFKWVSVLEAVCRKRDGELHMQII